MSQLPVLAYWDIQGLVEPIRLMLTYVGKQFDDKRYHCGDAPAFDKSSWLKEKFTLGLDFPNLPYYIDGSVKLTQTNAILRHLAREHDLEGQTPAEKNMVDLMTDQIMDLRNDFVRFSYGKIDDGIKDQYLTELDKKLEIFSKFLGNKKFLVGDKVTFPDFHFYVILWAHVRLSQKSVSKYSNLSEYINRFEQLPQIAAYIKSDKFQKTPINNKMASFGNDVINSY